MTILDRCIQYACEKHSGQVYRGYGSFKDEQYICHPLRVMLRLSQYHSDQEITNKLMQIAVLHDIIEDCNTTLDELIKSTGIDFFVSDSIDILTRVESVDYEAYIHRLITQPFWPPKIVKVCDLQENLSRKPTGSSLRNRYKVALSKLTDSLKLEGILTPSM